MEQMYSVTAFSIEFLEDIENSFGTSSEFSGKLMGKEFIKHTALKDEVFFCYTYFNSGEFEKNIISRLSYNFIPRKVYLHQIPQEPILYLECLQNFRKYNKHFTYNIGITGFDNNDFMIDCCTIEIIIDKLLEQ